MLQRALTPPHFKAFSFALLFGLFTLAGGAGMAAEEIAYSVIREQGDIEIRDYEETVVAEVTVTASRREAPGEAFMTLFRYIDGANIAAEEIPMTSPVSQEQASQKIPMTTPVSQERGADGPNEWVIAFHMPNDMSLDSTPKPTNEQVNIKSIPSRKMAAITFSGTRSDSNVGKHESELRRYLEKNNIAYIDEPVYAYYDPPWVPWFLRRNEVLFPLESDSE